MVTSSKQDLKSKAFYMALLAEFLGTLFLVLVACGSLYKSPTVMEISMCFALAIATIVWNIARVSGGHINPAVTFAFFVTRRISIVRAILYIGMQVMGAVVGAAILVPLTDTTWNLGTSTPGLKVGGAKMDGGEVIGIELLITFVLAWTVFATVDSGRRDLAGSGPLAIGLSIGMCHFWAVPVTGAGMNPARVFGPAVVSGSWEKHWAYWIGPIVGAAVAGIIYEFFFAVNATPAKLRGFFKLSYDPDRYDQTGGPRDVSSSDPHSSSTLPLKTNV